jgi:RES domain-containing protein
VLPAPIGPDAISELPAKSLRGQFHRIVPQHLRGQALSAEGCELYGGRYNPKGAFGAPYCGQTPAVCSAEVRRATAGRMATRFVLVSVNVERRRILDFTDQAILERLGLRSEDLARLDWTLTQELGRLARQAGFEALLVPSAAGPGSNLVLFLDRLGPASSVLLVAAEPVQL